MSEDVEQNQNLNEADAHPPGLQTRRVALQVGRSRPLKLELNAGQQLVMGRVREGDAVRPDIDFTRSGAVEHGVSRMHAALEVVQGEPCITDLQSTSGTRINGLLLEPGKAYRLHDEDEIELGSLRVQVRVAPSQ